jgi:hypothetical protein
MLKEHLFRLQTELGYEWYQLVLRQAWLSLATQPFKIECGEETTQLRTAAIPGKATLTAEIAWDSLEIAVKQGQQLLVGCHPHTFSLVQEAIIEYLADICLRYGLINLLVLKFARAEMATRAQQSVLPA